MNRKAQRGVSLIGILLWGIVIVLVAILVMKLVPAYVEFFTIKKVLVDIGQDPEIDAMSNAAIRAKFEKRSEIDTIHSVKPDDLDISRNEGETIISADYDFKSKLVGNISLLVEFHPSSSSAEARVRRQVQQVE